MLEIIFKQLLNFIQKLKFLSLFFSATFAKMSCLCAVLFNKKKKL